MKIGVLEITLIVLAVSNSSAYALTLEQQTAIYDSYASEKAGDIPKAVEKMVPVLQGAANDYFVNLRLGWLFLLEKKYKNSVDHYDRAYRSAPSSIEPLLGMTLVYMATASYDNARKACQLLLQRDPKNYTGLQRLTTSQIRLSDFSHALETANEALQLYPSDPVFLEQKAYSLKELGRTQEEKPVLSTLLLLSPLNEFARAQLNSR